VKEDPIMLSAILKELPQLKTNLQSNSFSFQKGKIFFGTVKNIFPNDTAIVQIGKQNIIAKLEVALTNGGAYWFQVDSEDGDIRLKLLSKQRPGDNDMSKIMKHLDLPSTKANKELVDFLTKEQIPLTKDSIKKCSEWLTNTSDVKKNLNTIKLILEKGFPLSESVYKSLLETENPEKVQNSIQLLERHLENEKQTPTVQAILSTLNSINNKNSIQTSNQVLHSLFQEAISNEDNNQAISVSILKKLGYDNNNGTSIKTLSKTTPIEAKLPVVIPNVIQDLAMNQESVEENLNVPQKVLDATVKLTKSISAKEIPPNEAINLSHQEWEYLEDIVHAIKQSFHRQNALNQFKDITKSLGLFYEAKLSHTEIEKNHFDGALKPLLIKYLQESNRATPAGDIAENLVLKMNGQQIQSYENGPIQQLFYEIPIQLFGFKTDLTMQWSGKKNEDGKIDPNYCHILFYLDMEHLHQTTVEMRVQNRVITVNVYNESTSLKDASQQLIPKLKEGLKELNYQLSAVNIIDRHSKPNLHPNVKINVGNKQYTGVDIRV
jgi:hypothetical protein